MPTDKTSRCRTRAGICFSLQPKLTRTRLRILQLMTEPFVVTRAPVDSHQMTVIRLVPKHGDIHSIPVARADDINHMPFTTLLSVQIAEW